MELPKSSFGGNNLSMVSDAKLLTAATETFMLHPSKTAKFNLGNNPEIAVLFLLTIMSSMN